ncbi:MAG: transketolase, partial [Hyphomicrobiales bacterium]|nr:transketolase [Hyphomicrobiales bacterium]
TQAAFGNILNTIASEDSELVSRIVTTSPDVAVSTNLAPWINKRGVFHGTQRDDTFQQEKVASPLKWTLSPEGQHIELGIAENNLFLMLSALGLSESLFGERLFPIGTVYDPFVNRGLDALIYGCYQDSRFMVAGTPSGIALAPEGGAHQSINTPLLGMSIPNLASFEPAFADELAAIVEWGLGHMQRQNGGSVYLRLSTRAVEQPQRTLGEELRAGIIAGAYWRQRPAPVVIAYTGAVAPEAAAALEILHNNGTGASLLAITSPDRLHADWLANRRKSHIAGLLRECGNGARIVSVVDGHPATLSWLGAVQGNPVYPLGVSAFGQSADIVDLFAHHRIDANAIAQAALQD